MAYVGEPDAANYKFTSALPAQLLKALTPHLRPLVDGSACTPVSTAALQSARAPGSGPAQPPR